MPRKAKKQKRLQQKTVTKATPKKVAEVKAEPAKVEDKRKSFLEKVKGLMPKRKPASNEPLNEFTKFVDSIKDDLAEHHRDDIARHARKHEITFGEAHAKYLRGYFGLPPDKYVYQVRD